MQTLNVNLFAGPGFGKSATAERLCALLRDRGHTVELVREFSKDLHWEGRLHSTEQFLVSAEQWHRQARVQGKVPVVITDSAVQLGFLHAPSSYRRQLEAVVQALMQDWTCFNVLLEREIEKDYSNFGRQESLTQARSHHRRVRELFAQYAKPGFSAVMDLDKESAIGELANRVCSVLVETEDGANLHSHCPEK